MSTSELTHTILIIGAGPGIGAATARRFAAEGYRVGLVARDARRLAELSLSLAADGVSVEIAAADVTDSDAVRAAVGSLVERLGDADVVCFSPLPSIDLIKPVLGTTPDDLAEALALAVGGAAAVVGAVAPAMLRSGSGTLLFTTGSGALRPSVDRAASAVATTAETSYVALVHEALAESGVHVAHVAIAGAVGPGLQHEPASIAEALWRRHVDRDRAQTVID